MKEVVLKLVVVIGLLVLVSGFFACEDIPNVEEERAYELLKAGYSSQQVLDQLQEEFFNSDGPYRTGGIDGFLIDGTAAPNSPYEGNS